MKQHDGLTHRDLPSPLMTHGMAATAVKSPGSRGGNVYTTSSGTLRYGASSSGSQDKKPAPMFARKRYGKGGFKASPEGKRYYEKQAFDKDYPPNARLYAESKMRSGIPPHDEAEYKMMKHIQKVGPEQPGPMGNNDKSWYLKLDIPRPSAPSNRFGRPDKRYLKGSDRTTIAKKKGKGSWAETLAKYGYSKEQSQEIMDKTLVK